MLKTLSAALIAVSVLAAPAMAGGFAHHGRAHGHAHDAKAQMHRHDIRDHHRHRHVRPQFNFHKKFAPHGTFHHSAKTVHKHG